MGWVSGLDLVAGYVRRCDLEQEISPFISFLASYQPPPPIYIYTHRQFDYLRLRHGRHDSSIVQGPTPFPNLANGLQEVAKVLHNIRHSKSQRLCFANLGQCFNLESQGNTVANLLQGTGFDNMHLPGKMTECRMPPLDPNATSQPDQGTGQQ